MNPSCIPVTDQKRCHGRENSHGQSHIPAVLHKLPFLIQGAFGSEGTDAHSAVICRRQKRVHGIGFPPDRGFRNKQRIILSRIGLTDPDIFPAVLIINIRPQQIQGRRSGLPDIQDPAHRRSGIIA